MKHLSTVSLFVVCLQVCGAQNSITSDLWHQERPLNLPQIENLEVMCAKDHMEVQLSFDKPFDGLVFSKGQFGSDNCVYVQPNTGSVNFRFSIIYNGCGTKPDAKGKFYENTVVVQYDEELIEVWDEAKRLRCEWYNDYEKTATKPPMVISDLEVIELNFRGDNVDCWMEIQNGKGPWASPITGIVPLGSTLTMVVAINDLAGEFDMRVKSCEASDGVNRPIVLSDEHGCVLRPKMVSKFLKLRSNDGRSTVMSYAFFHAFKFPDSLQVYVRCKVEICRFGCPEHCDKSNSADPSSYTSEIKASFSAPVRSALPAPVGPVAAVPVAAAVAQPQPPQLLPPQFTPQKYPERRSRPEPEVTRRPFFNLGSKPVFANFFQRKKDSVQAALPVLSPPPPAVAAAQIAQRLDVEAQVVAVPIPIPGSQTQSDQVVVAVPVPVVQPQTDAVQARDDSSDDSAASASDAQPISEDQYSERSSRFPHGPRSLNLDDLKNLIHIADAEEYAEKSASDVKGVKSRKRRYAFHERHVRSADVGVVTGYEVISAVDLAFTPNASASEGVTIFQSKMREDVVYGVCLPAPGFSALFVLLAMCVVISVLVSSFLCYHRQLQKDDRQGAATTPAPLLPFRDWNMVHFVRHPKSLEAQQS